MCRRRRRRHRVERLGWLDADARCTTGNQLFNVIDHSGPIVETSCKNDGLVNTGMTSMEKVEDGTNGRKGKHNTSAVKEHETFRDR